ncbi:MAG: hypothetical protein WBP18_04610 [Paracoccaceae bacterium]|jgi:hypothetical protein
MLRPPLLAVAASLSAAFPAAAEDPVPLPMTYAMFEQSIPHQDLAVCPEPLAAPGRFCRLTTFNGGLNVFAFAEDGDQPLVAFQTWPTDLLEGLMD